MLHRYLIPSVPLLASLVFAVVCVAAAMDAPDDPVLIRVPDGATLKKDRVQFPHSEHVAVDCAVCHHELQKQPENYSCSAKGCHDLANPSSSAERKSMAYFRNAFHANADMSCNGCHKKYKKEGKPAGPTSCKQCHSVK